MSKRVYTYHASLPGHNPEHETKLLLLWKQNWAHAGFEPIVLNEYIASEHELYGKFLEAIQQLPSVNKPGYEMACYLRWMAMLQVGGGFMTDHDLFCYDPKFNFGTKKPDQIALYQAHVPCLAWGTKKAYEKVVTGIMDYKVTEKDIEVNSKLPHVSDMYMFYREGIPFTSHNPVRSYGDDGWEQAPFVHFSSASMQGYSPRYLHIKELRQW